MRLQRLLLPLGVLLATALSGCGGGGGSGGDIASISLSGNAAKGALIGADVKAYEIINGVKSSSIWASTVTDGNGEYTLKSTPTQNPVVIEVVTNGQTTMVDESKIEANGMFAKVSAPAGMTLRSFVASMSESTSVQINPFTEAAVAIAYASVGSDKKLSLEVLMAAKQVALQMTPSGTNPFSDKPAMKATEMFDEQIKLGAMMAGMIKSADNTCDLNCQVKALSKDIKIDVGSDGKGTLTADAASSVQTRRTALLTQGQQAWVNDSLNASRLGTKMDDVSVATRSAINASKDNAVPTVTLSASDFAATEGLEGFIAALRNGFRATEKNLQNAKDDLDRKYQNLSLAGSEDTMDAIDRVKLDCFEDKITFACSRSAGSSVTWVQNGNSWTGTNTYRDGSKWEGTVSGTIVGDTMTGTLNAVKKNASGKRLTDIEGLNISATKDTPTAAGSFIFGGKIRAYAADDLVVTLTAKNWMATMSKSNDSPQKGILSGELDLTASNGDMLSGRIAAKGDKRKTTRNYCSPPYTCNYTTNRFSFTDMDLQLTAINNNSQLLKFGIIFNQNERDTTLAESSTNFDKYIGAASVVVSESLTLNVNMSQSDWVTEKIDTTILSGGSQVKLSGTFTTTNAIGGNSMRNKWCVSNDLRCTKELNLESSDKTYTATLTRVNGDAKGDIYKGITKVGVIQNGMLQINGREVSIY